MIPAAIKAPYSPSEWPIIDFVESDFETVTFFGS